MRAHTQSVNPSADTQRWGALLIRQTQLEKRQVTIQLETLRQQHEAFVLRHEDMINQIHLQGHQHPESDEKYVLELQAKAQAVSTLESRAEKKAAEFLLKDDEKKQDLERLKRELIAEEDSCKDLEGTLEKVRTETTLLEAQLGKLVESSLAWNKRTLV